MSKNMIIYRLKNTKKTYILIICFLCFTLIAALIIRFVPGSDLFADDTEERIKAGEEVFAEEDGEDAAIALEGIIARIAEGDLKGYSRTTVRSIGVIGEAFGEDAWENVTYDEVEAPMILSRDAYVICMTGEEISEAEYKRIIEDHIRAVCAENGYDRALVDKTGVEICAMSQDDITKYHQVNNEITRTCPVKLVAKPDGESRRFVLKFAGKSSAGDAGICDVTVDLVKIDGEWKLHVVLYSDPILPGDDV
ncbi:MAG: hypothetical protein WCR87_01330 [Saccharofermentanales bacterium]